MSEAVRVSEALATLGASAQACGSQDVDRVLEGAAPLTEAGPRHVTFATAVAASGERLRACRAALVIVDSGALAGFSEGELEPVVAGSDNARLDFIRVLRRHFSPPRPPPGIHLGASVAEGARIAEGVSVGAGCTIAGDVEIGAGSALHAGVHVYDGVRIGRCVTVHAGTVIGADGYGYERDEQGELVRFPQIGGVVIEDEAEIGANTCIDRGALGDTRIGARARIDNLVHIAHNVQVGEDAAVIAHAMLGGSVRIGAGAWIAPCACVREGISIGERAVVGLGAVVTADVPADATVLGNPAREQSLHRELQSALKRLAPPPS